MVNDVKVEPKICESNCGRSFFREVGSGERDCERCRTGGLQRALRGWELDRMFAARGSGRVGVGLTV